MRLYTLDEARALLPRVIPVLEQLKEAYTKVRAEQAEFARQVRGAAADGSLLADPWAQEPPPDRSPDLEHTLTEASHLLDTWGIELKDPARGLIDFYHLRNGETVFLCYLLGEPDIFYWHTLEGGFAGRQPLGSDE
jgi:hypothetical protein